MPSRTITTDAIGRYEALPEMATIEALAIGEGKSARDAKAVAKDRAATIRESVTGVSTDQIRTVNLEVRDTDEMFEPVTESPFQAKERLEIECTPENADSVVVDVTSAGGTVQTVHFHLHENTQQTLQNKALILATERAREKAERIAATEGLAVAEAQEVRTKEVTTGLDSLVDEALDSAPDTDVQPTPIAVSEKVEIAYALTEDET